MQGDTYGAGTATPDQPLQAVFDFDPVKHKYTYYLRQDNTDGSATYYNRLGYLDDNGGADTLIGGGSSDIIDGELGDDLIELGGGNDIGLGRDGSDTVQGGGGDDLIFGDFNYDASTPDPDLPDWARNAYAGLDGQYHGNDLLDGGDGNDTLYGNGGSDQLYGDAGDDTLYGDDLVTPGQFHGNDLLNGGDGNDQLEGNGGNDVVLGGAGDDLLWGDDNVLDGSFHGNDTLDGGAGNDQLVGGGGADELHGGDGDDLLIGDNSSDVPLSATFEGADILYGDAGNDELHGGGGNDCLDGGIGDDQLFGDAGDDTLVGGAGTDYLAGGAGNDTYVIGADDSPLNAAGHSEVIDDSEGANTVVLDSVSVDGTVLGGFGSMLALSFADGQQLAVLNGVSGAVQTYEFADGTQLSYSELVGHLSEVPMSSIDAQGQLHALGGRGDDSITAAQGGSILSGGRGDDTLQGEGGGNSYLFSQGDGHDTITDLGGIDPQTGQPVAASRVVFGAGVSASDLSLNFDTGLVIDVGSGGDQLRLDGVAASDVQAGPNITSFEFADGSVLSYQQLIARGFDLSGTAGDDSLIGTSVDDRFDGQAGNDTMQGGAGSDTYAWGIDAGQDVIDDGDTNAAATDTLRVGTGLSGSDLLLNRSGNDLIVHLVGSADTATVVNQFAGAGIEQMAFDDGTTWNASDIAAHVTNELTDAADTYTGTAGDDFIDSKGGDDTVYGNAGNDQMAGGAGNDMLFGDAGNDTLNGGTDFDSLDGGTGDDTLIDGEVMTGGAGNDTYQLTTWQPATINEDLASVSGSDTLVLPVDASQVQLERGYNVQTGWYDDLMIGIQGSGNYIVVPRYFASEGDDYKLQTIRFGDGSAWSVADVFAHVSGTLASDGADDITGYNWADTIDAKDGNDHVNAGPGDDQVNAGDGNDTVYGWTGSDSLAGGAGNDLLYGDFGDYSQTGDGNDVLDGGAGNDTLDGAGGNDSYVFGRGYGSDTVHDTGGTDRILLASGVQPGDVTLFRDGANLVLALDAGATQLKVVGSSPAWPIKWRASRLLTARYGTARPFRPEPWQERPTR